MESSEDDAGNATSASRRASARETDTGQAEEVEPSCDTQQQGSSEARASCRTPAMSEDTDGDSVPSPSQQDINTSTDAILDMIDEFVDGPGAPKRLQHSSSDQLIDACETASSNEPKPKQQIDTVEQPRTPSPTPIATSEILSSTLVKPAECTLSEVTLCASTSNVPQTSSVVDKIESSHQQTENSSMLSAEPKAVVQSDSPSSSVQTVQNVSNSECEQLELQRTVNVTSSDKRDSVSVERAESTSSECSVSESKGLPVEPLSRSPLRRRLVRPAPSDRRPDCTVSSTVHSQTSDINATQPTSSDVIVKDVSSSSDAVVPHGSKPAEISKVSEISICKAETSTAPKKIRLVRPRITPVLSNSVNTPEALTPENEQCQSTSSDDHASSFSVEPLSNRVTTAKSQDHDSHSAAVNSVTENVTIQTVTPINSIVNVTPSVNLETTLELSKNLSDKVKLSGVAQTIKLEPANVQEVLNPAKSEQSEPSSVPMEIVEAKDNCSKAMELQSQAKKPELIEILSKESETGNDSKISESTEIQSKELESSNQSTCLESSKVQPKVSKLSKDFIPLDTSDLRSKFLEGSEVQSKELESIHGLTHESIPGRNITDVQSKESELAHKESKNKVTKSILPANLEQTESKKMPVPDNKPSNKSTKEPVPEEIPILASMPVEIESIKSKPDEIQSVSLNPEEVPTLATKQKDIQASESLPEVIQTIESKPEEIEIIESKPASIASKSENNQTIKSNLEDFEAVESKQVETHAMESKPKEILEKLAPVTSKLEVPNLKEVETLDSELANIQSKTDSTEESEPTKELVEKDDGSIDKTPIEIQPIKLKAVDEHPKEIMEVLSEKMDSTEPELTNAGSEKNKEQTHKVKTDDEDKKRPPIKLTLSKVLKTAVKANDLDSQSIIKNLKAVHSSHDSRIHPLNTEVTITNCDSSIKTNFPEVPIEHKKVPPIKLNLTNSDHNSILQVSPQKRNATEDKSDSIKHVPKLTIKLGNKQAEEIKSPIPKLTIKPIRPPTAAEDGSENIQQFPSVTKLNIKPIVKPADGNERTEGESNENVNRKEQIPNITKLNIKPIPKPAEKINDIHRKSSSSEISESEYSENDESTSTYSDQASASDQGPSDAVPKLTIKLGKPGTESEGKFYTEKNVPKLTIKGLQQNENEDKDTKLKLVVSQSEDIKMDKVPKLTIKTMTKSESQPLSPKLTIKPIKPPENDTEIVKLKISPETFCSGSEIKENMHVPKLTIKAVTKTDLDTSSKTPKKAALMCDSSDHNIPIVTKLNIKPILKPIESGEGSEDLTDKVPVVSKLNIKPVVKPKDNDVDSSIEDVPKIIKLNIKPLKSPEEKSSVGKDCDENLVDKNNESIPVVTKLNIKPIVKPEEDEGIKDSENQSSETGTSSDDNDHIPVVTKLNIKPIVKPSEMEEASKHVPNEQSIPVVTKLNIKPLVKPDESCLPSSPKRESLRSPGSSGIPVVTKLNIKPIVKPEDTSDSKDSKIHDEIVDKLTKNPPLVMKINMKNVCENIIEQKYNNYVDGTKSPRQPISPKIKKSALTPDSENSKLITAANAEPQNITESCLGSPSIVSTAIPQSPSHRNCLLDKEDPTFSKENKTDVIQVPDKILGNKNVMFNEVYERNPEPVNASPLSPGSTKQKKSLQNCTLLKQLLSHTKDDSEKSRDMSISNCMPHTEKTEPPQTNCKATVNMVEEIRKYNLDLSIDLGKKSTISEVANDLSHPSRCLQSRSIHDVRKEANESVTKPLEIITDKASNQSSGQDSPRIILKINKTDHGSSAKIITEESHKPPDSPQNHAENTHDVMHEKQSPKKYLNHKRKQAADEAVSLVIGKRLRSSRVVETPEKPPVARRNAAKRSPATDTTTTTNKDTETTILDSKRLKLEQLLSANKGLTITPVASKITQTSPTKRTETKPSEKTMNHSLLKNDNSSKNGNSKLHNILSNLQAKQMQSLQLSEASIANKEPILVPDAESNTSTGSSDVVVEISRIDNCQEVQEMIINENSEFRDMSTPDEVSQDPLEVDVKTASEDVVEPVSLNAVELTPTPRKRGRPRKYPVSEGAKPPTPTPKPVTPPALPVPALEERPQRSLRLTRERPAILSKPRGGRGRGRGGRRAAAASPPAPAPSPPSDDEPTETVIVIETIEDERPPTPEDPTSSRIKLPRMTEALDKSQSSMTPLSSRRRSSTIEVKLFEPSVVIENPVKIEEFMKSPEASGTRGRGGRGRGTPRGRTPRGRGRGRGGGKGATYMKETMGIYGRVCGPATTTVELFEEETCMMDDNATPKPSHLLDEDSQSSVKSSTNDSSNKMKKSKFADLFDSNKVWMASDVKEYMWPPPEEPNVDHQVMMIQEQVAMFLGVKSFKRRYSELKRRAVVGEEKDYVLRRGIVTEALCDLGITAVDASDVLDIMLSDYPHKYEEYRSHQRQKQMTQTEDEKNEEKPSKVEMKAEKADGKPEPPKVDPEKTRQDMAAAAIASAAEWNAMANAWRRPACVDLQSNTIHRRRAPPATPPPTHCRPPAGFYPHAVLPQQYQHAYRLYTPAQLRYFPLNTVIAAPPAPPSPVESSSESEGTWDPCSSSDDSRAPHHAAKRKKLTKIKRSSQQDKEDSRQANAPEEVVDLCRVCKLRLEANRKYTHERFLVCAQCNAKLHPSCIDLGADTIRKCREYAWQCAECKTCCACSQPKDADKMVFCDLCDRGLHIYCAGLEQVPSGRWHCVECAVCKSCNARDPSGPAGGPSTPGTPGTSTPGPSGSAPGEWHHQTRRGPGGHKVYSHSLCTPCARAYRIGRYCPLCERSFIGPKGTMQLVICKLCDRQLHQECVRATVANLKVMDYTCGDCRRGGITSRAAAVRVAPRTIATLFMAKRRFNKYAHRQYMASRLKDALETEANEACESSELPPPDVSDSETCLEASDPLDNSRTDFAD